MRIVNTSIIRTPIQYTIGQVFCEKTGREPSQNECEVTWTHKSEEKKMLNDDNLSNFLLDGNMQVLGGDMEGGNFAPASQVRSRFELQIQFLRFCSRTHHHCVFVLVSFRFESFSLLFVFFQRIFFISQPFLNERFFLLNFFRIRNPYSKS